MDFTAKKYLNLVGYKFHGEISFPVLSELMYKMLTLKNLTQVYNFIDDFLLLVKTKRISLVSIKNTEDLVIKIKEEYPVITPNDRLIVACVIASGTKTLVTLDNKLIRNNKLQQDFKIKIVHPKDLL